MPLLLLIHRSDHLDIPLLFNATGCYWFGRSNGVNLTIFPGGGLRIEGWGLPYPITNYPDDGSGLLIQREILDRLPRYYCEVQM